MAKPNRTFKDRRQAEAQRKRQIEKFRQDIRKGWRPKR